MRLRSVGMVVGRRNRCDGLHRPGRASGLVKVLVTTWVSQVKASVVLVAVMTMVMTLD